MASNLFQQPKNNERVVENEQPPELFRKSKVTDITLLVEGKELHFVKYPLMEGSDMFTQMIENSTDQSKLKIDDVTYTDMIVFLECLHPKKYQSITDANIEQIATIAQKFKHEGVLKRCEDYILQEFQHFSTQSEKKFTYFFFCLRMAEKYGFENALQVGVSSIVVKKSYYSPKKRPYQGTTIPGYENDENFQKLSFETKYHILCTRLRIAEAGIDPNDPYLVHLYPSPF